MGDTFFKIRRKSDGKFSSGGSEPTFTKRGKIWTTRGAVTLHLRQVSALPKSSKFSGPTSIDGMTVFNHVYENAEIIEYETREVGEPILVMDYIQRIEDENERRKQVAIENLERKKKAERRKLYEQLKQEFDE